MICTNCEQNYSKLTPFSICQDCFDAELGEAQ